VNDIHDFYSMKANKRNASYLLSLIPGLVCFTGNYLGNWFTASNIIFSILILGVFEWILPANTENENSNQDNALPEMILLLHIPLQIACVFGLLNGIFNQAYTGIQMVLAALSTGILSGTSAVVVAHEYIHRKNKLKKALGLLLLFSAGNVYFYTAHLKIHHKWVGTDKDPASAKLNENVYAFFVRSVWGQIKESFLLEKKQNSKLNGLVLQFIIQLLWLVILYMTIGYWAIIAWLIHSITAAFLLEYVNYVEHYGLSRQANERATEMHSWDSNQPVSRFFLIDLSRHADHHYYASKPYHTLNSYPNGNKLPSGYAGLFFVAIFPPLWYKLIHPRISKL